MEDAMNVLLCVIIQILVWCGYSLVLYLSHHDHSFYETVLLVMFSYFNFLVAMRFFLNKTAGVNLTIFFTVIYIAGRILIL
jgi:ABC-type maltose transport system permease subunit